MRIEEFIALCDLTAKLTDLKVKQIPGLCIENFAPELLKKLIKETCSLVLPGLSSLMLSQSTADMLTKEGITTIEQILCMTSNDLLKVPRLGRRAHTEICQALGEKGLVLPTTQPSS